MTDQSYTTSAVQPPDQCDFCDASDPRWLFQADDMVMILDEVSLGAWLACDDCRLLVESRNLEGLVKRIGTYWQTKGLNTSEMNLVVVMLAGFYAELFSKLSPEPPTIASETRATCPHPPDRVRWADNERSRTKRSSLACGVCGLLVEATTTTEKDEE